MMTAFIPWPRTCGYCRAEIVEDEAPRHWLRGRVSRCRRRDENNDEPLLYGDGAA